MSQTIPTREITLYELETQFGLRLNRDPQFFPEWQTALPELSAHEQAFLDGVQASYLNLIKYPTMLENAVQLTVLSPLLHLSQFLVEPFHIRTETSVQIANEDGALTIEGRIDVLVLKENLWVLVIESKKAEFSLKVGLAQILAYMLKALDQNRPCYGLIINGGNFIFLKIEQVDNRPTYSLSKGFDLLQILKKIRHVALQDLYHKT